MKRVGLLVAVAILVVLAACGDSGSGPDIDNARIGQPTGPNAALYFRATGYGEPDRLRGANTSAAGSMELHETTMGDDGTMTMNSLEGLDLPADGEIVLEPGGYHLMLVDAERMEVGDVVEVMLDWQMAGEMTVRAEVVDPGDTMGDDG